MNDRTIVLYDGDCGLCSSAVQFLLAADRRGRLQFAARGTAAADGVTAPFGGAPAGIDSIIVVRGDRLLVRSDAALALADQLPMPWPLAGRVGTFVPRAVRDAIYDLIARNRRRFFPARACLVPSPEQRSRFL
jgi:predicted DCC family thiol-disulfide oxidoreductase YuxK